MGFLGGLFGRSRDRSDVAKDRCMDCGMTDGEHTDWCTSAQKTAKPSAAPRAPVDEGVEGDAPPPI